MFMFPSLPLKREQFQPTTNCNNCSYFQILYLLNMYEAIFALVMHNRKASSSLSSSRMVLLVMSQLPCIFLATIFVCFIPIMALVVDLWKLILWWWNIIFISPPLLVVRFNHYLTWIFQNFQISQFHFSQMRCN